MLIYQTVIISLLFAFSYSFLSDGNANPCEGLNSTSGREFVNLTDGSAVLCDLDTQDGPWIIIQRRHSSSVSFNETWAGYKEGFGDITTDFWLGLDRIHALCPQSCQLRVDLRHPGAAASVPTQPDETYHALYKRFAVADEAHLYRLTIGLYQQGSTAGDAMTSPYFSQDGAAFSTVDRDNDRRDGHNWAALRGNGGWWYSEYCGDAWLNGRWDDGLSQGIHGVHWFPVTGFGTGTFSEVKVKM